MMKNNPILILFFLIFTDNFSLIAEAGEYHLFNPVPKEKMREFITDRPDRTESPISVDAGHFQIETDLLILTKDKTTILGQTVESSGMGVMVSNLKAGLTDHIDFQVVVTPYLSGKASVNGSEIVNVDGFGDTTLRLKWNWMGNQGEDFAMGVMPFVNLPTNSNASLGHKKIEAGIILPFGLGLPDEWSLGWMLQYNRAKNEADDAFHHEYVTTLTVGHPLVGDLNGYVEFWNQASSEQDAEWQATLDMGITYEVVKDVQLDLGMNIGVTESTEDLSPFLGISARI